MKRGWSTYPHGWDVWSNAALKRLWQRKGIQPSWIYTSEEADAPQYLEAFRVERCWSILNARLHEYPVGAQIREIRFVAVYSYRSEAVFRAYVAILGGESSGKRSTLVNKLANILHTTSALWEYGRDMSFRITGGDEMALQYSDYDKIALGHAQYVICSEICE